MSSWSTIRKSRHQCLAIVPNYESYVVQKWMRIPDEKLLAGPVRKGNLLDPTLPLRTKYGRTGHEEKWIQ